MLKVRSPAARENVVKSDRPSHPKKRSPVAREKVVKGSQPFDVKKSDRWKFLLSQVSLCP
jgi:hypothetical protein